MSNPIIRLLDKDQHTLIDSLSTEYEDSFSLDSFLDLIQMYAKSDEKSFIIARVQTLDPKQPEKAFYSYYEAYALNKVLFNTQQYMEKRLIHR